jgi:hypothetical protein
MGELRRADAAPPPSLSPRSASGEERREEGVTADRDRRRPCTGVCFKLEVDVEVEGSKGRGVEFAFEFEWGRGSVSSPVREDWGVSAGLAPTKPLPTPPPLTADLQKERRVRWKGLLEGSLGRGEMWLSGGRFLSPIEDTSACSMYNWMTSIHMRYIQIDLHARTWRVAGGCHRCVGAGGSYH